MIPCALQAAKPALRAGKRRFEISFQRMALILFNHE